MRWHRALWRPMAVVFRWLLLWLSMVTLTFVGLRLVSAAPRDTLELWPLLFLRFLTQLVRGDWGTSAHGHTVIDMVAAGLPVDLLLGAGALLVAWVVGVLWGLAAVARAQGLLGSWLMRIARGFVSLSVVALVPLCAWLVPSAERWSMVFGGILWLPMLILALPYAAEFARATHRSARAALASEIVFMARAKGLPRRWIWTRYVLPTAWLPFTTEGGLPLASVFTSVLTAVVVIENLLGVAGTGSFFVTAARQQDYAVIAGLGLVYSTLLIAANLAMDLLRGASRPADSNAVSAVSAVSSEPA